MRVLYNKLRCVANPNWYANRVEWIQTDLTLEVYRRAKILALEMIIYQCQKLGAEILNTTGVFREFGVM